MPDTPRRYSDHEFALILRKAAELANHTDLAAPASDGLTLAEMKAAAAQAGIDPALVERASHMIATDAPTSTLEQLFGGPVRHDAAARFPVALDEQTAARILSAVRISAAQAGNADVGHSSAIGVTWHDGNATEALSVTALPDGDGTAVAVSIDRTGALVSTTIYASMFMFLSGFVGFIVTSQVPIEIGIAVGLTGMGASAAVARHYWVSSTRSIRARISAALDAVGKTIDG